MTLYLGENLISGTQIVTDKSERIGQIIQSTIPLTDAGLHLLDGALLSGCGGYADFVDYIADLYGDGTNVPDYFCTESDWQMSVTNYGVCGKFVYDSVNNTVRLPKYSNKIYSSLENSSLYGYTSDIYGTYHTYPLLTSNTHPVGEATDYLIVNGSGTTRYTWVTNPEGDAAKIEGAYADLLNINTAIEGYYYIVVATSTKINIEVDIDEITTDLNGKADVDLSNVPNSKGILTESYVNGSSWYRVYSDGWCEQGGVVPYGSDTEYTGTLLKPYANMNYQIGFTTVSQNTSSVASQWQYIAIYPRTASTFGCKSINFERGWRACGYIR